MRYGRACILGDAVEWSLQIDEGDSHALSDVAPELAARTREALLREIEGTEQPMTGSHFPEPAFGRVVTGTGRRFVPVD